MNWSCNPCIRIDVNDRHNNILRLLSKDHETSVKILTEALNVSAVTIRQDLNFL
ncbi:MAG: DeoR family transcriptional regulator, partial [Cyclobacteriaceae bacterium]|nr:DeoR family transcriptional regulator [Cyclobacteriaceae bacterium]